MTLPYASPDTMLFRYHCGGLEESIKTCVVLPNSMAALREHLAKRYPFAMDQDRPPVRVEPYALHGDDRIGWDEVWIVLEAGYPTGWTNTAVIDE